MTIKVNIHQQVTPKELIGSLNFCRLIPFLNYEIAILAFSKNYR
jgi:hypothetical protein